jgi:RNA polymerase sigma-70 factor (ECF subfamily)
LLGDFDLAEEAMHEAFAAALSLWPSSGVPGNPRLWLTRPNSLLKNSRFVSGYRFSDTASRLKSDAPLGAGHWNSTFSANCEADADIEMTSRKA